MCLASITQVMVTCMVQVDSVSLCNNTGERGYEVLLGGRKME